MRQIAAKERGRVASRERNRIAVLTAFFIILLSLPVDILGQFPANVDDGWKWIVPLKTQKSEVEKVFGESITEDKSHPFQTYVAAFGKINIAYETERTYWKEFQSTVNAGTVLHYFISPKRLVLSDLKMDMTKFRRDANYAPRELSYFSEEKGILIATEIVQNEDGSKTERVIALEYRPIVVANQEKSPAKAKP